MDQWDEFSGMPDDVQGPEESFFVFFGRLCGFAAGLCIGAFVVWVLWP